jgi:hypothetical protein
MSKAKRQTPYWGPDKTTRYLLPAQLEEWEAHWGRYLTEKYGQDSVPSPEPTADEPERDHERRPADPVKKARHDEAMAYVRDYAGTWAFVLDLRADKRWGTKYMRLTERQVEVVLASKEREAGWAAEREAKVRNGTAVDLTVLPTGTTRYAVENADGDLTFIRIDHVDSGKWEGWVFVKQVTGGGVAGMDNEHRLGSQKPGALYQGTFDRLLLKVLADPEGAARRYGLELGACSVCGRTLTNAESRERGIGPECAQKWAA